LADALIYAPLRTPIGRQGGALAAVRADDLAAVPVRAVLERTSIDASILDDVILGCSNQGGEDSRNVARMATLLAGVPVSVPAQTVNRLCGSGLQAVASAAHVIQAGEAQVVLAGGVESMTRAPYAMLKSGVPWNRMPPQIADTTVGWRFTNPRLPKEWTVSLGETAENVAQRFDVSREDQEAFALESQRRTAEAMRSGWFDAELVPVEVPGKRGARTVVAQDEHPRPELELADLQRLKPAFREAGSVTAGTSSGINDGAAAMLVADRSIELDAQPVARILGTAVAGVEPDFMGLGPIPATRKLLDRLGVSIEEIDLVELNEAFAAQSLACIRELGLDPERVNVHGGAIALGHPLGCSGARILVTLLHALERTGGRLGLASMCIGVGQGISMLVERV
jgi:3-oxoadipyl-CoA thiolase